MRILQINAVYEYSSTGRIITDLHKYLLSQGHESYVAAVNIRHNERNLIKISNKLSQGFHGLMSHLTGRQGYYSFFVTRSLLRKIDLIRPDVIHLGVLHSNCLNIPMLLRYVANNNIPTVLTLHDCWFFTGHCCYFIDANCDRWKQECGNCPELHTWNRSWFFDQTTRNLKDKRNLFTAINRLAVIGVSDWVTNFIHESILKDSYIIRRIYNWVDVDKFKPTESNMRQRYGIENEFVVLGVAQNWNMQKGVYDIKTLAELYPKIKILLVGNMPQEYYPLPSNIVVAGVTASVQELVEYYSCADVFFNPSVRETFGMVTAEALACGTPVVAYNLTATPELINADCGFLTEHQDFDAVIKSLNAIFKKSKKAYTVNCRRFAIDTFSQKKLMDEYVKLYQQLIKEN